jgi:hypothetical protein
MRHTRNHHPLTQILTRLMLDAGANSPSSNVTWAMFDRSTRLRGTIWNQQDEQDQSYQLDLDTDYNEALRLHVSISVQCR